MSAGRPSGAPSRPPRLPYIALAAGLFACVALLALHPLDNFDTCLHLATGNWILDHHAVPRQNLFMYTAPDYPYIDHTWLSQVLFASIYRVWGPAGLEVLTALCWAGAFGILLALWRRLGVGAHLAAIPFLTVAVLDPGRYAPRPELFTNLFLATTAYLALGWRHSGHRAIWALPALAAVWVNCHGGVTAGLAFLWILVAGEGLQALIARRWPVAWLPALPFARWRTLALVALAASAAVVVNPYHVGWFEAVSPSRLRFLATTMREWQPLLQRAALGGATVGLVFAFMGLAALSFAFTRRLYLGNLLLAAAFITSTITSQRNIAVGGLVLLAVMGSNLSARRWPEPLARVAGPRMALRWALGVVAIGWWAVILGFAWGEPALGWLGMQFRPGFGIARNELPVRAEQFWRTQRLPARLFTPTAYSGYVVWKHPQGRPVFIDGHNAFGWPLRGQYLEMFSAPGNEALIRRWKINTIMLPQPDPARPGPEPYRDLCVLLAQSPQWRLVFWDGVSVIYLRESPAHRALLDRYGYRYLDPTDLRSPAYAEHPEQVAAELERATAASPDAPFLRVLAGSIYLHLDMLNRAAAEFVAALRLEPYQHGAYTGLGLAALRSGRAEEAEAMFRRAARLAPGDPAPHGGLATLAEMQGDAGRAAAEWRAVLSRNPNPETAALARSRLAALGGDR